MKGNPFLLWVLTRFSPFVTFFQCAILTFHSSTPYVMWKVRQFLYRPGRTLRIRLPDFKTVAHEGGKVVSPTYGPPSPPPGTIPGTHFCSRLSWTQSHNAAWRIMWMESSSDTTENWTCDLPTCSAVPQPTPPSAEKLDFGKHVGKQNLGEQSAGYRWGQKPRNKTNKTEMRRGKKVLFMLHCNLLVCAHCKMH